MPTSSARLAPIAAKTVAAKTVVTRCPLPTPRTAAGFERLWATVPDAQWGGGDVGLSVQISDGRSVWLFGDSWRPGAVDGAHLVHSAALVQDAGCVVAANGGRQLFPDDTDGAYYWIHDAHELDGGRISVRARGVLSTGGRGPWAFRDAGFWRTRTFRVTAAGNLALTSAGPRVAGVAPAAGRFFTAAGVATSRPDPQHFFYSRRSHPEFVLANGRVLTTIAQNWGDGRPHHNPSWKACYAPVALSGSTARRGGLVQ
jgi:hypothetical protein